MNTATDFKNIALKEIKVDPNQPRKMFDAAAMEELTSSVKEKGILQPILIRPNGKGYILVCGERRFKAATSAGLEEIPAVIRTLSDDEALDLQIIENLQRKDIHPMEEAVAFKSLVESKSRPATHEEVGARVGKSVYYVRQRLKLNNLSKQWQEIFYQNKMNVSQAIMICVVAEKEQGELFKAKVSLRDLKDPHYHIDIDEDDVERIQRKLKKAPFDITDPTLNPKMGPCTNCPFNTAVSSLFPEDTKDPTCTNASCYEIKCDNHFVKALNEVKDDPSIIFIYDHISEYRDKKGANIYKNLEKAGHKMYQVTTYNHGPEYCEEVSEKMTDFKKLLDAGKILKGFYIAGDERGTFAYVKMRPGSSSKKTTSKGTAEKIKEGKVTAADLDNEIDRIQTKEKRSKEIDQQRIWEELRKQFNPSVNASMLKDEFSQVEREAIAAAIHNKLSYGGSDGFHKLFKIDGRSPDYSKVDAVAIKQMIRFFFLDVLPPSILYSGYNKDALICLKVAGQYFPTVLKDVQDKQKQASDKRQERIAKRITDLREQKKELGTKPVTKKAVPKKSAPKKK